MAGLRELIREIHRRSLWQVLGVYLLGAWGALQVVDVLANNFGLPKWFPPLALALIVIGLPIVLATAFVQDGAPGRSGPAAGAEAKPSPPADMAAPGPDVAGPAGPPGGMFTWKNAIGGGVAASLLWGTLAVGWLVFRGAPRGEGGGGIPSVAVLPLVNRSSEDGSAYFVDGLHDDLLTELSKISGLRVISRTSVMQYRDTDKTVRQIGQELGVGAVLEGGVERQGDEVRINVQLIDSKNDTHLWAETYDETLTAATVFAIRSDLTHKIAAALRARLTPAEEARVDRAPTDNLAAYDLVLRGRELYDGGAKDVERALELFREATRLQADYAGAWAWLGDAFGQRVQKGGYGAVMADSAVWAARRAIELDPEEPEAYKALGLGLDQLGRLGEAERAYARALELRPNWTVPRTNLSATLYSTGHFAEGVRLMLEARALDPKYVFPAGHLVMHWAALGVPEEAKRWAAVARTVDPDWYWSPLMESIAARQRGDLDAARSATSEAMGRYPGDPNVMLFALQVEMAARNASGLEGIASELLRDHPDWGRGSAADVRLDLAWARRVSGRPEGTDSLVAEAERMLQATLARAQEDPGPLVAMGAARALEGDADGAVSWLTRAVDAGYRLDIGADPRLDALRDDARVQALRKRVDDDLARQLAEVRPLIGTGR